MQEPEPRTPNLFLTNLELQQKLFFHECKPNFPEFETTPLSHLCTLVPTFLGAHTLPPEYKDDAAGYVELIISEMIPAVAEWYGHSHFSQQQILLFIDVFCEDHAFDVAQTRRILSMSHMGWGVTLIEIFDFRFSIFDFRFSIKCSQLSGCVAY